MQCVSLSDVKFDGRSIDAIEDIKRRNNLTLILSRLMPASTMINIFMGRGGGISTSYNISSSDFEALAKAVLSLPAIQRKVIRDIASYQALSHSGKENQFWRGVAEGCGFE